MTEDFSLESLSVSVIKNDTVINVKPFKNVIKISKDGYVGPRGRGIEELEGKFEFINRNLNSLPFVLNYDNDILVSIDYNSGEVVKSFSYFQERLISVSLSGSFGVLTKTLVYDNDLLVGVTYS